MAVQASRLSTALHRGCSPGNLPEGKVHGCPNPLTTFFGKGMPSRFCCFTKFKINVSNIVRFKRGAIFKERVNKLIYFYDEFLPF